MYQMSSEIGTAQLALDESMLPWSQATHKWVVCIPRKPQPIGMRTYLAAMELPLSQQVVVHTVFPDMWDSGCWRRQVCSTCSGEYAEYSQSSLSGLTRSARATHCTVARNRHMPPHATITVDSLFSNHVNAYGYLDHNVYLCCAAKSSSLRALWHKLPEAHHRAFTQGQQAYFVWSDNSIVCQRTTVHKRERERERERREEHRSVSINITSQ